MRTWYLLVAGCAVVALVARADTASRVRAPEKCGRALVDAAEQVAHAGGGNVPYPNRSLCPTAVFPRGYTVVETKWGERWILRPDGSRLMRQVERSALDARSRPKVWTEAGALFLEVE